MSEFSEQLSHLQDKLEEKHSENIDRLGKIEARLAAMEGNQHHLDGCLDRLRDALDVTMETFGNRISALEKWVWRTTGWLGAGFGLINVVLLLLKYFNP